MITNPKNGKAAEYPDNFCQLVNHVGNDYHLDGIRVCLEKPSKSFWPFGPDYDDSAILGIQAFHIDDGVEVEANPIGNMSCSSDERQVFRKVNGRNVGEVKMGFEKDGEGVAIKFRDRDDELIRKTGEREKGMMKTFAIPDDEELVGFHGA